MSEKQTHRTDAVAFGLQIKLSQRAAPALPAPFPALPALHPWLLLNYLTAECQAALIGTATLALSLQNYFSR